MKKKSATAITIFFFLPRAVINRRNNGKKNFYFIFSFTYIFLNLNEKYCIPFERKFIQDENATKFTFLPFFNEYLCQHNLLFFFHQITQQLSYLNQFDFDFDYTSLKYNH